MKFSKKYPEQQTVASLNRSVSRSKLRRSWIKLSTITSRGKKFFRDYRLPALTTAGFILLVLMLTIVRQFERTSLLALINEVTDGASGYSTLLSNDQRQEFIRDDSSVDEDVEANDNESTQAVDSTQNTSTPFTIESNENDGANTPASISNTNQSAPSPGSTNPGTGTGGGTNGGNTVDPPEEDPFEAKVDSFREQSATLECTNPSKPSKGSCSKRYVFQGSIKTENGPGSVSYEWVSSISAGNGSGSFSVGSGKVITTISKEVSLRCNQDTSFTMQLSIVSPLFTSSNERTIDHDCDEI